MPDDEGMALYEAGVKAGRVGPLFEIGTYCGKSAVYLGAAAREAGTVLFTVDHHRGSDENQAGWEHHDTRGRRSRRPAAWTRCRSSGARSNAAGLEDVVDRRHRALGTGRARRGARRSGCCSSTAATREDVALADYEGWSANVVPGGVLVFHDVFEDPADGGQAPFDVWQRAVADGFVPASTTGSLRVLRAR